MAALPQSDHYDSVTCSLVADIDLDGENEILLGTYGQVFYPYLFKGQLRGWYNC